MIFSTVVLGGQVSSLPNILHPWLTKFPYIAAILQPYCLYLSTYKFVLFWIDSCRLDTQLSDLVCSGWTHNCAQLSILLLLNQVHSQSGSITKILLFKISCVGIFSGLIPTPTVKWQIFYANLLDFNFQKFYSKENCFE